LSDDTADEKGPTKIGDAELATLLGEMNSQSVGYLTDQVSADQDDNLDRYLGKPYGDEEDGSSNAISMDVAEVVDWALPDLLEPFLAGERIVDFTPSTRKDEDYCEQAGDLANHCFYSENSGVIVLHDTIKTACIQKIGFIKTWWHKEEIEERQTLTGLAKTNVDELRQEDGVTIEEEAGEPLNAELIPPEALAAFGDGMVYTVTIVRQKTKGTPCIESVPPEEIKVSQRSKSLVGIDYVCHEPEKTRGQLIAMGFDYDTVMGLAANKGSEKDSRKDHRFSDEQRQESGTRAKLSDTVTLCEEYPLLDMDGTGKIKRWQVFRVNKTILGKEEIDDHPFDAWSADRIPHRLIGLALADKVKQTQYIKTHLTRGLLNNVYLANNPRIEVPDAAAGDNTIDDLLTYRIGGLIRSKGQGNMIRPIEVPDRSANALQAITYMDSVREQQSGITRNGMAVSSEAIDPKSATEARKEDRNEQSRKRLMVRMIAETLLVPVFRKILNLLVKYQDAEKTIYLSGKWVTMDPRTWSADLKATVAVGLGHANSEEDLLAAQIVGQAQQLGAEAGLVGPEQLYETGKKLIRAVGWKFPEKYFKDPSTPEFQQEAQARAQQGDPKMVEVQGKLKLKEMEMQMDSQFESIKAERDLQIEMLKAQAKMAIEKEKVGFDFQAKLMQINAEFQLKQQQMFAELQLQRQQMGFEARMAKSQQDIDADNENRRIESDHEAKMTKAKMKPVKFGGKVG
jgi:hypothetical protein